MIIEVSHDLQVVDIIPNARSYGSHRQLAGPLQCAVTTPSSCSQGRWLSASSSIAEHYSLYRPNALEGPS